MASLFEKFQDGGPFFTYPLLIFLIIVVALFVSAMMKKDETKKLQELMLHVGWFAVAWGFLGRTFGLISAFDMVAAHGELTPSLLAGGLKMALLNPLFGIFVFLVARIGVIILVAIQKKLADQN